MRTDTQDTGWEDAAQTPPSSSGWWVNSTAPGQILRRLHAEPEEKVKMPVIRSLKIPNVCLSP